MSSALALVTFDGFKKPLFVSVNNEELSIYYGEETADILVRMTPEVMQSILDGRMTFQRAFMTGEMTAKGDFKTLRMLDQLFPIAG